MATIDHRDIFEGGHSRASAGAGPPLTPEMVAGAEATLGYRLPTAYVRLLEGQNGGYLKLRYHPAPVPTSWAEDHVSIATLSSIGDEDGIDGELGSRYLIGEWGYPDTGIVIGDGESSGHTALMLDYSLCGPQGEPRVVWVEPDGVVELAPDFETFLSGLSEEPTSRPEKPGSGEL